MTEVGVHEAKTHLSRLLRRVAAGEEDRDHERRPPGRTARAGPPSRGSRVGLDHGRLEVPDDFDEPLPVGLVEAFER